MSSELLIALKTTWDSLPNDVQAIIVGAAGELAATLTTNVIGGLSRPFRRRIKGTPAEQALEGAFDEGLRACMAALTPPDAWREERYIAALKHFLSLEEVADEFVVLVDVHPDVDLNVERLQELFEASGRELARLPGLNFEDAMQAFALAYCDAVERSGVQQHVDQLRHLKQIVSRLDAVRHETALSREELARVRESVGAVEHALRQGLAEQTRVFQEVMGVYHSLPEDATATALQELASRIAELSDTILRAVRQDAEAFRQADLEIKEAAYRILIASEFERLDFRGMLQHGQPVTLPLERVYVSLRAAQRVPTADTLEMERLRQQLEDDDARQTEGQPSILDDEQRAELEQQLDELETTRWRKETEHVDLHNALSDVDDLGMIVLGDPGAGKTTLLKYLALIFARDAASAKLKLDERRLPIFLPLAFYDAALSERPELSLGDYLAGYYANEKNLPGLKPLFDAALRERRAIVLLDGLDEVLEAETRSRVGRRVEAFMRQETERGNRVLLTSRIVGYRGVELPADISHFTILDMGSAVVHAFVERWALALTCQVRNESFEAPSVRAQDEANELATGLKEAIEESESVRRLAVNPLLLTILAVVYTQEGMTLPRRRVELYNRYTRILIETWRRTRTAGRFVGKEMEFLPTAKILGPLALWLQEEWPSGTVPGPRLRERLMDVFLKRLGWQPGQHPDDELEERAHRQAEDFLADVREFAGVLVERGRDTYGFLHLTFQEYFAAWCLAKMDADERMDFLRHHLHTPRWREVILLTAGQLGVIEENERQVSNFVESILHAHSPVPELYRDLLLAAACLADDVGVRLDLGQAIVRGLAEPLNSPVPALAQAAGEALGGLSETPLTTHAVDLAMAMLNDGANGWNRQTAVRSLGQLSQASPMVVDALITAFSNNNPSIRQAAASGLRRLGQASLEVTEALIAALSDRSTSFVCRPAATILGQLGQASPEVTEALIAALSDRKSSVRQVAAISLGQLGQTSSEVTEALIAALSDRDPSVRRAAASSLSQLGQASPEVTEALIVALSDRKSVRRAAASSLSQLSQTSPEVTEALIAALSDRDPSVRRGVASSLSQLGQASPGVTEALIAALSDHMTSVRQAAANSLGQLGQASPEVTEALVAALSDRKPSVCQAAAVGLGQLGQASPKVTEALIATLSDHDPSVRWGAASSLSQLGQAPPELTKIIKALVVARSKGSRSTRRATLKILGSLSQASPEVIKALIDDFTHSQWQVRQTAVRTLGQLGQASPEVTKALIVALSDEQWHVRQEAAMRLGRLSQISSEVTEALIATLSDNQWHVRWHAAAGLGRLGQASPEVTKALITALSDNQSHVRQTAARAFAQLGQATPEVIEVLIADLSHSMPHRRRRSARALAQLRHTSPGLVEALVTALSDDKPEVRNTAYQALLALAPQATG